MIGISLNVIAYATLHTHSCTNTTYLFVSGRSDELLCYCIK